ncbi:magnesium chelatase subunit D [Brevundimonas variabilis]|uniref:Magnesium chelatase subunit D n=1 Tax=Brevundimonas variabilis TaxID=74312 RepID=A0A7W9CHY6_9CAUL|nr:magnesium chelatase subunit D [Brevundimonas variabilis]
MKDAATVWAEAMLAAALLAVDPRLGGVVVRAGPGPVRDAWVSGFRALFDVETPWRRLPPGIGDERLLGGLDLGAALGSGRKVLQRGLLAEADGGVVIAPMAERLTSGTASRLAAALDSGVISLERDGMAERLGARFVMVALDEGADDGERVGPGLSEHLAFAIDLDGVGHRDALPISATVADVAEAREALTHVGAPDQAMVEAICGAAEAFGIGSIRAPLLALRVAAALAALEGRDVIDPEDLSTAARLVLAPRATRMPDVTAEAEPESQPDDIPPSEPEAEQREPDATPPEDELDTAENDDMAAMLDDVVLDAVRAALPDGLDALWMDQGRAAQSAAMSSGRSGARRASPDRGRRIASRPGLPKQASGLDVVETLKAAAPWQKVRGALLGLDRGPMRIRRDDFRVRRFEQRSESTVIFVVDASGSAALQRLAETKGAVELLLAEAYVKRTQVALIAFRGTAAELLLPPTRSLTRARRSLAELAGGGATPLAAALEAAAILGVAERAKGRTPVLVIMTDGRGNIALDGAAFRTRAETDALNAARRIRGTGMAVALIDISPRPRGDGQKLAEAMGARFAALPYVEAGRVRDVVRSLEGVG